MFKRVLKYIYHLIPFKKEFFLLLKTLYSPPDNLFRHLTFKGEFKVNSGTNQFKILHHGFLIENQIFWRGFDGFEPNSLKLWAKLSRNSKFILDIGANTGVYALTAKSENPLSEVHAFEPVERVFEKLQKNVSLNNFDITCHRLAVSNSDGVGMFFDDDEEHQTSVIINMDRSEEDNLHRVETPLITLDTFIKQNTIQSIDLMKVDVETHEPELIEGFKKNIGNFQPTLIIEIIRDFVAASLQQHFDEVGYEFYYIDDSKKVDCYQKVEKLAGSPFGNYLICTKSTAVSLGIT